MIALPETQAVPVRGDPAPGRPDRPEPVAPRAATGRSSSSIRPFQPGDPLRRVNWRTTLRTGEVHSVGTSAAGGQLGADPGRRRHRRRRQRRRRRGGQHPGRDRARRERAGRPTTSASATGSRCGCSAAPDRCSAPARACGTSAASQELLAQVQPGWPEALSTRRLRLRIGAGSVVVVLTPLLTPDITTAMVTLVPPRAGRRLHRHPGRRARCPTRPRTHAPPGQLAWRLRLLEREIQLTEVARRGIPVVPWRGPGSLDDVLRRLARRARMPREVPR